LSNSVGENSSPSKPVKGKDSPRSLNIKALSHALNQIPSSLTPLFQCAISSFFFVVFGSLTIHFSHRQALLHASYSRC
jgi:hypothetical protein